MSTDDTMLVHTSEADFTRGRSLQPIKVEVLCENVNLFLTQIESILNDVPDEVGKFRITEFVVSAEVSAKGQLTLLGSGVEAAAKGGLTFKFQKST